MGDYSILKLTTYRSEDMVVQECLELHGTRDTLRTGRKSSVREHINRLKIPSKHESHMHQRKGTVAPVPVSFRGRSISRPPKSIRERTALSYPDIVGIETQGQSFANRFMNAEVYIL
jgi:hypothetical protein